MHTLTITGGRFTTLHTLSQEIGKDLFDQYMAWYELEERMPFRVLASLDTCHHIKFIEQFLQERNIAFDTDVS